jgi:hypothetical protein
MAGGETRIVAGGWFRDRRRVTGRLWKIADIVTLVEDVAQEHESDERGLPERTS